MQSGMRAVRININRRVQVTSASEAARASRVGEETSVGEADRDAYADPARPRTS